jgi:hypothetical protein
MAVDKKETPRGAIKAAGVLWIIIGFGILIFQPTHLTTEGRILAELMCGIGGGLHLAVADLMKQLETLRHVHRH